MTAQNDDERTMAITFALDVAVPCSCRKEGVENDCAAVLSNCPVDQLGSSDSVLVVSASSVSMSRNRQLASTNKSQVSYLGIFVPPSLLSGRNCRDLGTPTGCQQVRVINDISIRDSLASELLTSIHPFLLEHGKLVGIVSAAASSHTQQQKEEESTPADVVLIDVSNAPQHWWHDIKASVNGEPMAAAPTAVIKLIPLSSIVITTRTSESNSRIPSEIPTCAVCLHRIDPFRLGMGKPQNHQLCSQFCPGHVTAGQSGDACRNQEFLRPWLPPSNCIACHVIHDRWKNYLSLTTTSLQENHNQKDDLFCKSCAMQETLWICLTCGFVGCGRYSHRHAAQHYDDSSHPYSLELATLRIWDYASGEFVQRGDLLECPSVQRGVIGIGSEHSSTSLDQAFARSGDHHDAHSTMGQSFQQSVQSLDKESPKKANMIGEEYEALLQSALEDQAQHYEGEITRLRAELTAENADAQAMTKEEAKEIDELKEDVARFRTEIEHLSRQLLDAQAQEAGYRAESQRLLREQSVAKDLLDKIKEETARENMEGQMQVDELEQQVADLTANLRMRRQFSQDGELSNAQIVGTTGTSSTKSTKRGKKIRRMFRK